MVCRWEVMLIAQAKEIVSQLKDRDISGDISDLQDVYRRMRRLVNEIEVSNVAQRKALDARFHLCS
jgi:hypothetical protein